MWTWLNDHWVYVAVVVSEVLPFIPGKINGILQAILKIGSSIFKKA
jgi:hypothetical protein